MGLTMNVKKWLFASIAGVVGVAVPTLLLEQVILADFMQSSVNEPMGFKMEGFAYWAAVVLYVIIVFVMAYMYPIGYAGGKPWLEGLRFGVLIGIIIACVWTQLFLLSCTPSAAAVIVSFLTTLTGPAIGGMAIGFVYGRMGKVSE
jgi:hypothetical protein